MKIISTGILFVLLSACGDSTTTVSQTKDSTTTDHTQNDPDTLSDFTESCYMQILKRDTMVLHLKQRGDELTGRMTFDNYEKDGSSGNVLGARQGDTLVLMYSFQSEGMNSVSAEYFKMEGNDLVRGTGEIANRGDTTYFTNPEKISYNGGRWKRTDCDKIPEKYRIKVQ